MDVSLIFFPKDELIDFVSALTQLAIYSGVLAEKMNYFLQSLGTSLD
jgi:hypothetical protein